MKELIRKLLERQYTKKDILFGVGVAIFVYFVIRGQIPVDKVVQFITNWLAF